MPTFDKCFNEIDRLTHLELKPLEAILGKLMEEVGETAEGVLIHQGHITHKHMKEPLVGEIADVVQQALSILVKITPGYTPKARRELFLTTLERKSKKWGDVQQGELKRKEAAEKAARIDPEVVAMRDLQRRKPCTPAGDIEYRVKKIVGQQLGIYNPIVSTSLELKAPFVEAYGADSLDLVELCMAIEDEFEMEISDADAEAIFTTQQVIDYVKMRYGIVEAGEEEPDESACADAEEVNTEQRQRALPSGFFEPLHHDAEQEPYSDPASDYMDRSGRHLSLSERMQERSIHRNK